MKNKIPTIQQLKDAGFEVRVRRQRYWDYFHPKTNRVLISKSEFPEEVNDVIERRKLFHKKEKLGWHLSPKGGVTEVIITSPDNFFNLNSPVEAWGESVCHEDDYFNKRTGRNCALGRAISEFKQLTGMTLTSEFLESYRQWKIRNELFDEEHVAIRAESDRHGHPHLDDEDPMADEWRGIRNVANRFSRPLGPGSEPSGNGSSSGEPTPVIVFADNDEE